jgi:hypothetical protein
MTRIAIIGAGMAGVSLAYTLKDHADIVLIEKSRGVSGRIAHRRAAQVGFDHGAAYMTIRDPQFADLMAPYISAGLLQNWPQHPVRLASGTATEPKSPSPDSYAVSGAANALVKPLPRIIWPVLISGYRPEQGKSHVTILMQKQYGALRLIKGLMTAQKQTKARIFWPTG